MSSGSIKRSSTAGAALDIAFDGTAFKWTTYRNPVQWHRHGDRGRGHALRTRPLQLGLRLQGHGLRAHGASPRAAHGQGRGHGQGKGWRARPLGRHRHGRGQRDALPGGFADPRLRGDRWPPALRRDLVDLEPSQTSSSGALKRTRTAGAALDIAFEGTAFKWTTYRNPYSGIATVTVDGGTPFEVDLYSSGYDFKATALRAHGASPRARTRSGWRPPGRARAGALGRLGRHRHGRGQRDALPGGALSRRRRSRAATDRVRHANCERGLRSPLCRCRAESGYRQRPFLGKHE